MAWYPSSSRSAGATEASVLQQITKWKLQSASSVSSVQQASSSNNTPSQATQSNNVTPPLSPQELTMIESKFEKRLNEINTLAKVIQESKKVC